MQVREELVQGVLTCLVFGMLQCRQPSLAWFFPVPQMLCCVLFFFFLNAAEACLPRFLRY